MALAGGLTLVSGCRPHNCIEKGAVVVDRDGNVRAIGLLHYSCSLAPAMKSGYACGRTRSFTLVTRGEAAAAAVTALDA